VVVVYNPRKEGNYIVKIKVPHGNLSIFDSKNNKQEAEVTCKEKDQQDCTLFMKKNLKETSLNYYMIVPSDKENIMLKSGTVEAANPQSLIIDEKRELIFSKLDGKIELSFIICPNANDKSKCKKNAFKLSYNYFISAWGGDQPSGVYIFRPDHTTQEGSIPFWHPNSISFLKGKILSELRVNLSSFFLADLSEFHASRWGKAEKIK